LKQAADAGSLEVPAQLYAHTIKEEIPFEDALSELPPTMIAEPEAVVREWLQHHTTLISDMRLLHESTLTNIQSRFYYPLQTAFKGTTSALAQVFEDTVMPFNRQVSRTTC
jgi:hypothetical protein